MANPMPGVEAAGDFRLFVRPLSKCLPVGSCSPSDAARPLARAKLGKASSSARSISREILGVPADTAFGSVPAFDTGRRDGAVVHAGRAAVTVWMGNPFGEAG